MILFICDLLESEFEWLLLVMFDTANLVLYISVIWNIFALVSSLFCKCFQLLGDTVNSLVFRVYHVATFNTRLSRDKDRNSWTLNKAFDSSTSTQGGNSLRYRIHESINNALLCFVRQSCGLVLTVFTTFPINEDVRAESVQHSL